MKKNQEIIKGFKITDKFRLNPIIYCKCGCGETLFENDKYGRSRKFIHEHSNRGKFNYMYGKHLSEEHKKKISESEKGKKDSEETRKKKSESQIGKKHTKETKLKISKANSGKNNYWYEITSSNHPMYGRKHTTESRKKMSVAHTGVKFSEERIEKMRITSTGRKHTAISKQKMSEAHKGEKSYMWGKKHTEEENEKNRIGQYRITITSERFKNTKPERFLQSILSVNEITYETQKKLYGRPDIFIEPNLCVFVDGDYHHQCKESKKYYGCPNWLYTRLAKITTPRNIWNHDEMVTKTLEDQGYIIIRIWEHEIYDDPIGCLEKIEDKI